MWPSFRLVPRFNKYGAFPASGQIDIFESRGNQKLFLSGKNIGSEMITSGLHFGPDKVHNAVNTASVSTNSGKGHGYHAGFHVYGLEWTDGITVKHIGLVICVRSKIIAQFEFIASRPYFIFDRQRDS